MRAEDIVMGQFYKWRRTKGGYTRVRAVYFLTAPQPQAPPEYPLYGNGPYALVLCLWQRTRVEAYPQELEPYTAAEEAAYRAVEAAKRKERKTARQAFQVIQDALMEKLNVDRTAVRPARSGGVVIRLDPEDLQRVLR